MVQRLDKSPTSSVAATEQHRPVLRYGTTRPEVKTLQMKLGRKSFRKSRDKLDGIFGPKTRADVIQFQSTHGLTPDGVVGAQTWNALDTYTPQEVHEEDEVAADEVFATGVVALNTNRNELAVNLFTTVLGMAATSSKETANRSHLNRAVAHHRLGHFAKAVADFERALASTHTSTKRRATALADLQRARRNLPPNAALEGAVDGDGDGVKARPDLAPGSTGRDVELLQVKLFSLRLITKTRVHYDDGVFDAGTGARLALFKSEVGLTAGPAVDAETWHALDTYSPQDRTKGDRDDFIAQYNAAVKAQKGDPKGGHLAFEALEPLAWTPEMRAEIRFKLGLSQHARSEFAAAVQSYREALETPRLPASTFSPHARADILNMFARKARRGEMPDDPRFRA